jgi:hypothetical protein
MKGADFMGIYYDGTKLLSMKDINGKKPEILYRIVDGEAVGTRFVGKK